VVSTTIHEDLLFFEPRPYHSQGLSNQDLSQRNTNTLCRGRHQNYTKSEKKSPALEFLLQNKSCCYTKPPVQTSITSSLLHPSKAHRICSVKMAGYSWEDFFEIFYSYSNYLFFALSWRLLWVQSWHALAGWEAGKYLKHFAWRRERSQRSLVFGLDVSILFTSFPYMFSTFVERIPDVGNLEPVRFVVFRDRG